MSGINILCINLQNRGDPKWLPKNRGTNLFKRTCLLDHAAILSSFFPIYIHLIHLFSLPYILIFFMLMKKILFILVFLFYSIDITAQLPPAEQVQYYYKCFADGNDN